jgi:hypothetical protein
VATAPPNSGQNSMAMWVGSPCFCRAVSASSMIATDAAPAVMAMMTPATGKLVARLRTGMSGRLIRYWSTTSATIISAPATSGMNTMTLISR